MKTRVYIYNVYLNNIADGIHLANDIKDGQIVKILNKPNLRAVCNYRRRW